VEQLAGMLEQAVGRQCRAHSFPSLGAAHPHPGLLVVCAALAFRAPGFVLVTGSTNRPALTALRKVSVFRPSRSATVPPFRYFFTCRFMLIALIPNARTISTCLQVPFYGAGCPGSARPTLRWQHPF
jgi:hypothetical protein